MNQMVRNNNKNKNYNSSNSLVFGQWPQAKIWDYTRWRYQDFGTPPPNFATQK